ncbi:hypothetical protein SASPL_149535 [Salvia splendens]|uniref:Vesicle transport v-SNARE N-terminal domain-containing protein n=1 Tax=Salvia splendens TaxID=180675 RepID=A0A8X8WBW1_SALSN|nr:hypothetical protein SASPL_149535 [Salvia splendens]
MSQVFEGYERQYCEISANLSKKVTSATVLDGGKALLLLGGFDENMEISHLRFADDFLKACNLFLLPFAADIGGTFPLAEQKKQKVSEVAGGLEDAEALIRKMDLEARSLPPGVKATLLVKLREYKTDLNNLKSEVKRIASGNANQAARDDLMQSSMATASADQRARLLMSTEKLGKSSDRIREGRKTMLETEELGVSILHDLHQQRQSLLHAHNNVRHVFLSCQPPSGEPV